MNKTDRRCVKTKAAIQNAFIGLITEKDYSDIRVTDIVKKANIGRKTFYLHYDNKEDVLNEIQDDFYSNADRRVRKYFEKNQEYDIHNVTKDLNFMIIQYEPFLRAAAKRDNFHLLQEMLNGCLKRIITAVLSDKYNINNAETSTYAEFYSSGITAMVIFWLKGNSPLTLDQLTNVAEHVCFQGADYILQSKLI